MRKNRNQRGAALIELAFVLPVLLVMTFVVTEFGRAIYQYNTLTKSVRDAVRYLSIQAPNTQVPEAKNLVLYGTTTAGTTPLVAGLTDTMVYTDWPAPTGTNPPIKTVSVEVRGFKFHSLFLTAFGLPFGTINFSPITATMRSQV